MLQHNLHLLSNHIFQHGSPSTISGGSLPSFVLMALLYIERPCAHIILKDIFTFNDLYILTVISLLGVISKLLEKTATHMIADQLG